MKHRATLLAMFVTMIFVLPFIASNTGAAKISTIVATTSLNSEGTTKAKEQADILRIQFPRVVKAFMNRLISPGEMRTIYDGGMKGRDEIIKSSLASFEAGKTDLVTLKKVTFSVTDDCSDRCQTLSDGYDDGCRAAGGIPLTASSELPWYTAGASMAMDAEEEEALEQFANNLFMLL